MQDLIGQAATTTIKSDDNNTAGPNLTILTVHGTNDAAAENEGSRWWQRGSTFIERLTSELQHLGVTNPEIIPVHWSGANSDFDRLSGSSKLAAEIARLERAGRLHAIIAHSHGGNVTMEALGRRHRSRNLVGVVSFGTPFFARALKSVPFTIALFKLLLGVVIAPIMLWYLTEILPTDSNKKIESVVLFGGLFALAMLSLRSGYRDLRHGSVARANMARGIDPKRWLVIHSPRDEAMRLLETAGQLTPTYVSVPGAIRSITNFGTMAGVIGTAAVFALTGSYFLAPIIEKYHAGKYGLAMAADFTFLLLVPVVYGAIYAAFWIFARLGGGWLYAKLLSRTIHGGVLGAAYGGDGRFRLTGVTRTPPYLDGVSESRLEALNLGGIDERAIFVSAQQLYDGIVANETPNAGLGDPDKMWKLLSDALYHNAYMRDDGVITHVAGHLARGLRNGW